MSAPNGKDWQHIPNFNIGSYFRFLCQGGSFIAHEEQTRVHNYTLGNIVIETCLAIWNAFVDIHMRFPSPDEVRESAFRFWLETGFPMTWAALDGKHFEIRNPADANTIYRCYRGFYSVNVQGD